KVGKHCLITLREKPEHVVLVWIPITQDAHNRCKVIDRAPLKSCHNFGVQNAVNVRRSIACALAMNLTAKLSHQEWMTAEVLNKLRVQHFLKSQAHISAKLPHHFSRLLDCKGRHVLAWN